MKRNPEKLAPSVPLPARRAARSAAIALPVLAALLLAGCAGFERDWKRVEAGTGSRAQAAPAGAWTGTWTSAGTGHQGRLRCLVSDSERAPAIPADGAPGTQATFTYHATWGIFSGTFPTQQPIVRQPGGGVRSTGAWTLPKWAGGRYDYDIAIAGEDFRGTWKGGGDTGTFEMRRPAGAAPVPSSP